jgi:hypothetical protein
MGKIIANQVQMEPTLLLIAGLGNSGEDHWQQYWLNAFPQVRKLEQDDWEEPQLEPWLTRLQETLRTIASPTILIAHSLGVSLVLHWAKSCTDPKVKGALLVAPADVDSPKHTPARIRNFAPMPLGKLPFASTVVASENDPYVSITRAGYFAEKWGSELVYVGQKGHINAQSGLGVWPEGQSMLKSLLDKCIT